jgi:hypothetical protein
MDPITGVGLAASSAQLADLTVKVLTNLYKYYRNVKGAPAKAADLRNELDNLIELLSNIQETFERTPSGLFSSAIPKALSNLREVVTQLYSRTKPEDTSGIRRLQWPFRQNENAEIIDKLERYKGNLMVALDINTTYCSLFVQH